jgi:hypothetical protein
VATQDDAIDEEPQSSLNHFGIFSLTEDYWRLGEEKRSDLQASWIENMGDVAEGVRHYRTSPTRPYTLLDAPVHVGIHAPSNRPDELWP